jgi:hypothetical protein
VSRSDGGVKTLQKKRFTKNRVEFIAQKIDKNPKPFFLDFFNHVFGRFSVRKKTP